jgi:hypothetical protein
MGTLAITKITDQKREQKEEIQQDYKHPTTDVDNEKETTDDPWKEIEHIVSHYYQKSGISYSGSMKLIDDNNDEEKILEEMSFDYTLVGDEYYYNMGSFEFINKNNFLLAVDNGSKTISISHQPQSSTQGSQLFNLSDFKKILEQKGAEAKVTQVADEKIITVDNIQDPSIQGYRIFYSPSTYQVRKMEIGMVRLSSLDDNENDRRETQTKAKDQNNKVIEENNELTTYTYFLEVNYTKIKPLTLEKGAFTPENKFITITNNKIQLMPAYSDYSLLNTGE